MRRSTIASLVVFAGAMLVAAYSIYQLETAVEDTKRSVASAKMISLDTNRIVRQELADTKARLEAANYVLNQQAAPAIVHMLKVLRAAGLQTPEVLLSPSEPPFKPPPR